jgi:flagellar hook-basal body complex protein FliE
MTIDPTALKSVASTVARDSALTPRPGAAAGGGFGDTLTKFLDAVDQSDGAANVAVNDMLNGRGDVHNAMIAMQRAEAMLQLAVQMRNKLVQAYQDIMRMPM